MTDVNAKYNEVPSYVIKEKAIKTAVIKYDSGIYLIISYRPYDCSFNIKNADVCAIINYHGKLHLIINGINTVFQDTEKDDLLHFHPTYYRFNGLDGKHVDVNMTFHLDSTFDLKSITINDQTKYLIP